MKVVTEYNNKQALKKPYIVAGAFCDQMNDVKHDDAKKVCEKYGAELIPVNGKTGEGVKQLFLQLTKKIEFQSEIKSADSGKHSPTLCNQGGQL